MNITRGLVRIGIVATVLWLAIAPVVLASNSIREGFNRASNFQAHCLKMERLNLPSGAIDHTAIVEKCAKVYYQQTKEVTEPHPYWKFLAGCAAVAAVAWLLAFVAYVIGQWIVRGFRSRPPPGPHQDAQTFQSGAQQSIEGEEPNPLREYIWIMLCLFAGVIIKQAGGFSGFDGAVIMGAAGAIGAVVQWFAKKARGHG